MGFSNVDLLVLAALAVIRNFAVPSLVPDSNQGELIDSYSQTWILAADNIVVLHQLLVDRTLPYLHNQIERQTVDHHTLAGYYTVDH